MKVYLHDVNRGLGVFLLAVSFLLPGCSSSGGRRASVPVTVDATAQVVEQARQTWLQEHLTGVFTDVRRSGRGVMVGVSGWSGSSMVAVTALC